MGIEELQVKEEITISALKANIYSLGFILPVVLLLGLPYWALWGADIGEMAGEKSNDAGAKQLLWLHLLQMRQWFGPATVVLLLGIVMHELMHGITWALYCQHGWQSIRFGIVWKVLTPYAHCKEPLKVWPYRLGTFMPALMLGLLPGLIGLITGSGAVLAFGMFFTMAAGGDFIMLWLTRHLQADQWVQDHPDKIGCLVLS